MTTPLTIRDTPDGCTLQVWFHPAAKHSALAGVHEGTLRITLTAPPADDRANEAIITLVAERLNLPRARVSLLRGARSRSKILRIVGLKSADVQAILGPDFC